jgi:two-component system OmpR family response regulator
MDAASQDAVLIADDDAALRLLCRVNLELEGYRVLEAASAGEVHRVVSEEDVAGVLLDVRLGEDDGLAVARALRETHPGLPIALFTGSVDHTDLWDEFADGYLKKPFSLDALGETVRRLVSR